MPTHNYTLQLLGASDTSAISAFMQNHHIATQAHYYRTSFRGKPWNILIYGSYASMADAKQAINQLPPAVKALKPFVRPLQDVHQAVSTNK